MIAKTLRFELIIKDFIHEGTGKNYFLWHVV